MPLRGSTCLALEGSVLPLPLLAACVGVSREAAFAAALAVVPAGCEGSLELRPRLHVTLAAERREAAVAAALAVVLAAAAATAAAAAAAAAIYT